MRWNSLSKKSLLLSIFLLFVAILNPQIVNAQKKNTFPAHVDTMLYRDMHFRTVGPSRGGRVTAVEGLRDYPHTFYMGAAAAGGVWRTTNYGQSWTNLTDGKGFKSTAIGAIEVADSDTSIIYVGTGSSSIRANVTTGRGIYKSSDAGNSWKRIGLKDAGQIGAIKVDPRNPNRVYVAALGHPFGKNKQRGVFRTTDGGKTWKKVLFTSDSTGAVDLEFNPENPDEIYAVMWRAERKPWTIISGAAREDGIYKSTDGGDTWTKLSNGLPEGLIGKIDLAVTPADTSRIYALVEAPGDQQGLYRSDDSGTSWKQVSDTTGIMTRPFYFTDITANPVHPDTVYVGNVRYWVSYDGGKTFKRQHVAHADVHTLWINPDHPQIQIQGNDGGATVTLDGGKTWSTENNQPTAELYQVNVDNRFPYWLYAGQQDYSTISVPSLPPAESGINPQSLWHITGGCETGPAVPQTNNPNIVFANCKGRFGQYNTATGQEQNYYVGAQYMYGRNPAKLEYRFQRVAPIEISPHDSSVVYNGSQFVHRTTNGGKTWKRISPDLTADKPQYQVASGEPITRDITGEEVFSTLYAIQVSPHNKNVIWTGSNDGPVHITRDGGKHWKDVTPGSIPPNGRVDGIAPSPHHAGKAYIAIQRRLLDDFHPYIFRTTDYGKHWTLLTDGNNGIPADYPVRVVREDPNCEGLLYAGTDFGLFISFDDGKHWQPFRQGLPTTVVSGIKIHDKDLVLSTMGRGFWILDDLSPLYQLDKELASHTNNYLYAPRDAYRMRYYGGGSKVPQYPESGAIIDFNIAHITNQKITLDILKEDGTVLRRFAGKMKDSNTSSDRAILSDSKPTPFGKPDSIDIHQGHNRFIWNLRYPGKTVPGPDGKVYFGSNYGPLVTPGDYQVRLTIGDWSQTQNLHLKIDPRIKSNGITNNDLHAQLNLNLKIRDALGKAHRFAANIDTLRKKLKDSENRKQTTSILDKLNNLYNRIVTSEKGSYPPPMLIDQLNYLYHMTTSSDQRPGNDAYNRFRRLHKMLDKIAVDWKTLKNGIDIQ